MGLGSSLNFGPGLALAIRWFLIGLGCLIIISLLVALILWQYKRKKWFLKVIVKLPRAGGLIISEVAKGRYDTNAGIVDIKRKGVKPAGMKPFDLKFFLQGEKTLEVIQIGPTDYIPVLTTSYDKVTIVDSDGKKVETALTKLETDLLRRKTWKNYMERTAKHRFTLQGFLEAHWRAIELSVVIFIMFIGFLILWMKIPKVCG